MDVGYRNVVCEPLPMDNCIDMCIDMCRDMCRDTSVDMCRDTSVDMYVDMCTEMCGLGHLALPRHVLIVEEDCVVYRHVSRHVHR